MTLPEQAPCGLPRPELSLPMEEEPSSSLEDSPIDTKEPLMPSSGTPIVRRVTAMDEEQEDYDDDDASFTLQQELNEILEAWFELVSEEEIQVYQRYLEDIKGQQIAEGALGNGEMAPTFALEDQDGDTVELQQHLAAGKHVVLVFYRGKWCPHCNATLMRYQKELLPELQSRNVSLIALSPMLPDGTQYLATKRNLQFSVCSDANNVVARQYGITMEIQPHTRPYMETWGENVPHHNGPDNWEIPLPSVYVIAPSGRILWSFVDNDTGVRAEPADIVASLPQPTTVNAQEESNSQSDLPFWRIKPETAPDSETALILPPPPSTSPCDALSDDHSESGEQTSMNSKNRVNRRTGFHALRRSCKGLLSSFGGSNKGSPKTNRKKNKDCSTCCGLEKASKAATSITKDCADCGTNPLSSAETLSTTYSSFSASSPSGRKSNHRCSRSGSSYSRASTRTSRTFRSSQSSQEFLMQYVLPPTD